MTLYRHFDGINDYDEWVIVHGAWEKGEAPEGTRVLRDIGGDNMGEFMVPVEPVDVSIVCDGCGGRGRQVEEVTDVECRRCGGAGRRVARIVIVDREDTE